MAGMPAAVGTVAPQLAAGLDAGLDAWSALNPDRSPRTLEEYRWHLRALARAGIAAPEDATREAVTRWMYARAKSGTKPATINQALAALRAALHGLEDTGAVARGAVAALAGVRMKVRLPRRFSARHLTVAEADRLLALARERAPRLYVPLAVAIYAGMRAGEVARMHASEVRLEDRTIWVRHRPELGKHGRVKSRSERLVPVCAPLLAILAPEVARAASSTDGYLFGALAPSRKGPQPRRPFLTAHTLWRLLHYTVKGTEIEWVNWRITRHTAASAWIQAGVALEKVSVWLGHDDVEITARFYAALKPGYDPDCEKRLAS